MNIENILVPVDFSEKTRNALDYACFIAEKFHARITLLYVLSVSLLGTDKQQQHSGYQEWLSEKELEALHKLNSLSQSIEKNNIDVDTAVVRDNHEHLAAEDFIKENQVDLLAMGITKRERYAESSYNITTERMIKSSTVPFLTTRFPLQKDSIRSILAPVAFSDDCQEEIDFAVQFAKRFDSKVEFLHVIEERKDPGYRAVESSLQKLLECVGSKDADYACTAIEGKTLEKITEYAGDIGAELIIMTIRESHKTGYSSSVMDMITSVSCPVFAVPGQ